MCKFGVFFKKTLTFFLAVFCLPFVCYATPTVSASSAILINANTGEIIYEKQADERRAMASTTKIMTAIVAIENGDLDATITVPAGAVGIEGSSLYLKKGEKMTLYELLQGLMLRSANDAAEAIALSLCGSVDAFADLMNEKAKVLGLCNTHFTNPHGLHDEEHYTTAKELGIIASYAMKNETFREICSLKKANLPGNRIVVNHNKLLFSFEGACGVKTGFTKSSGRCLVSAAERDGVMLVAVTLNAPNDWNDHKEMLEYGFMEFESVTLAKRGDVFYSLPIIGGSKDNVLVTAETDLTVCLRKNRASIVEKIELMKPRFAPVYKGEIVGRVIYTLNGIEIASTNLVADEYIGERQTKYSLFDKIKNFFG